MTTRTRQKRRSEEWLRGEGAGAAAAAEMVMRHGRSFAEFGLRDLQAHSRTHDGRNDFHRGYVHGYARVVDAKGKSREAIEMEGLLGQAGFDPVHAARLMREGMGPTELRGRLAIREGTGSLQHSHGIRRALAPAGTSPSRGKTKAELDEEIKSYLGD